jgi:hypothetical protein
MSRAHSRNDNDRGKQKYSKKNMPRYLFVHHNKPHTESARKDDIKLIISTFFCDSTTWIEMGNKMINERFCYDRHELSFGSFTAGTG